MVFPPLRPGEAPNEEEGASADTRKGVKRVRFTVSERTMIRKHDKVELKGKEHLRADPTWRWRRPAPSMTMRASCCRLSSTSLKMRSAVPKNTYSSVGRWGLS